MGGFIEFRKTIQDVERIENDQIVCLQLVMVTQLPVLRHRLGNSCLVPACSTLHRAPGTPQASTDVVDTTYECCGMPKTRVESFLHVPSDRIQGS